MKGFRSSLFFIVLCLLLACFACSKKTDTKAPDPGGPGGNNPPPAEEIKVTASIQGQVVDENDIPVQGAVVTSGTSTATTDVNGAFNFSHISLSARFGFVKAARQGYFTGSRSILTGEGKSSYISIKLVPRTSKGTFSASGGGAITVQTGSSVTFTGGSVVNAATNTAYNGTVHVYGAYLDPTDSLVSRRMPGDLRGVDTGGKEKLLQSFGMMIMSGWRVMEVRNCQIAQGKTATLSMAIPPGLSLVRLRPFLCGIFLDGQMDRAGDGCPAG